MKRFWIVALCMALVLCLAACSESAAEAETALETMAPVTPSPEEVQMASESDAQAAEQEPEASATDAAWDDTDYLAAQACIGLTVEELYDEIGEPESAQYAASCEEEDAEDGMLFYDDFYVWTVRTAEEEIVHDVYLMD